MSNYSLFNDDLDLHDALLSVDELICKYENLYKEHKIYWNPKTVKTRAWSFILYPESAPENWLEILNSFHCPFCISPLHDKDLKSDGSPKKAHYHCIYISEGPCYYKTCLVFMNLIGGIRLEPIHSLRGSVRYLIHLDETNKHHYMQEDIISLAGFDPSEFLEVSELQFEQVSKSMTEYILSHNVDEYGVFAGICLSKNPLWYRVLTKVHPRHFQFLITSLRHCASDFSFTLFMSFIKPLVSKDFYDELEDLYCTFMNINLSKKLDSDKIQCSKKEDSDI